MHIFQPAQDLELPERKNCKLLLAYLETTKAENFRGLECDIKAPGDPEELYIPEKYIQEYDVSIRYEGTELGSCTLESEGAYISGKWVAESAHLRLAQVVNHIMIMIRSARSFADTLNLFFCCSVP